MKNSIKLIILLFGSSTLLLNCVNERDLLGEEISEHQYTEHQTRIIRGNKIPKSVINFIDQASSGTKQVQFNKSTGGISFSK